jgi:sugar lactone lactonase YvrE
MKINIKILTAFFLFISINITYGQWTNGQAADLVLGQPNLTSNTANNGGKNASSLNRSGGIAIDFTNNKMYVADEDNSRVLRYSYPITTDQQAAELVLGQTAFNSSGGGTAQNKFDEPRDLAVDNTGRLWVLDKDNHRIVWFNAAHTISSNGSNADGVLGQTDFTSKSTGRTQSKFSFAYGIDVSTSGTLWVADNGNHRILRFDDAANKANGANADGVLGQTNFTNGSNATTQSGLNSPYDIVISNDGTLWAADYLNHRVLRFDDAANKANGANADGVLGQTDFTSGGGGTSQSKLKNILGITLDLSGNLYTASFSNNRVMIFMDAANKSNGANADYVLGQSDFTSNGTGITATNMSIGFKSGLFIDNTNNYLWVGDANNHRVIRFTASSSLPVELTSFQGKLMDNGNQLNWKTASELNNKGFEVERSIGGQDWENIGFIQGNGTTQERKDYSFLDEIPSSDINYYRLKQIDFDGKFEYSEIISIENKKINTITQIFPNPVSDFLNLTSSEHITRIAIYNNLGQLMQQQIISSDATYTLKIDTKALPSNAYILQIQKQNGQIETQKFVKY